jgi:hypothetical protein
MVRLQAELGPEGTARMEAFLAYEFTHHGDVRIFVHPPGQK